MGMLQKTERTVFDCAVCPLLHFTEPRVDEGKRRNDEARRASATSDLGMRDMIVRVS